MSTYVLAATQGWGVIQNAAGDVDTGLTVTGATFYTDNTGATPLTPVLTDNKGRIPGYIEVGKHSITYGGLTYEVEAVSGSLLASVESGAALGYVIPRNLIGDGATSDLGSIMDALTLGNSTKRPVYLPPPEGAAYAIDAPIDVNSIGTIIRGGRSEDTKILQLTDDCPIFRSNTDNTHSVTIENLRGYWTKQQDATNHPQSQFVQWTLSGGTTTGFYHWFLRNLKCDLATDALGIYDPTASLQIPVWALKVDGLLAAAMGRSIIQLASGSGVGQPANIFDGVRLMQRLAQVTTTTAQTLAADVTMNVGDASRFAASGVAIAKASGLQPVPFSYTGKTSTTLTGVSGLLATLPSGSAIGLVPDGPAINLRGEWSFTGLEVENWVDRVLYTDTGNVGKLINTHIEHHMVVTSSIKLIDVDNGRYHVDGFECGDFNAYATGSHAVVRGGANSDIEVSRPRIDVTAGAGSLSVITGQPRTMHLRGGGLPTGSGLGTGNNRWFFDNPTAQACWTMDGHPPRLDNTISLPTAAAAYRGRMFRKETTSQGDVTWICLPDAAGTYAWVPVVTNGAPVWCKVHRGSAQSLADSSDVALTWDVEDADVYAMHSTSSNTDRIVAVVPGLYMVTAGCIFAANATGYRELRIYKTLSGGGTTQLRAERVINNGATDETRVSTSVLVELAVGDYLQAIARQTSGGALNTANSNTIHGFEVARVG